MTHSLALNPFRMMKIKGGSRKSAREIQQEQREKVKREKVRTCHGKIPPDVDNI